MLGRVHSQESQHTTVHTTPTKATNGSADDQRIHVWGTTAQSRARFEECHRDKVQHFGVELGVHLAPDQISDAIPTVPDGIDAYQNKFVPAAARKNAAESHGNLLIAPNRSTIAG